MLGTQYVTKLATAIRARAVPDLLAMNDIDTILFIVRDVFTDLTDLVAQLPGRERLSPGQLDLSTLDDRVYGLRSSPTTPCSGTTRSSWTAPASTRRPR